MDEKRQTKLTSDCKVENKVTGHIFDMNPLYKKEGYIVENMGQKFKITACGALDTKGTFSLSVFFIFVYFRSKIPELVIIKIRFFWEFNFA